VQNKNDSQNLLGDLESIRSLLREEAADSNTTTPEKIPILLEAITEVIPTLKEIVDSPEPTTTTRNAYAFDNTPPQPITSATEARLTLEGEQLIENLLEEYLPLMESRLREQLRLRLSFIIKEQMRKYR